MSIGHVSRSQVIQLFMGVFATGIIQKLPATPNLLAVLRNNLALDYAQTSWWRYTSQSFVLCIVLTRPNILSW